MVDKITMGYLRGLIESNNKDYDTDFHLVEAYNFLELWNGGSRLAVGSKKEIYNAFVKYRFNEKFKKVK